ncbi:ZBED8 (predicted) [Pycnogonum litorale]
MGPDRVRTYKDEFLSLGFTSIVDKGVEKPQCVVCAKVLSAASMKRNHLQRHFKTEHSQLRDKDQAFFKRKLEALNARKLDVTGGVCRQNAALVEASFMIAYRIAKTKKAAYYRRRTDNAVYQGRCAVGHWTGSSQKAECCFCVGQYYTTPYRRYL